VTGIFLDIQKYIYLSIPKGLYIDTCLYIWGEKLANAETQVDAIVTMIVGFVAIVIGVLLIPLLAGFLATAKADTNVTSIAGLVNLIDIIAYLFVFAIIAVGIGLMVIGFRKIKGD